MRVTIGIITFQRPDGLAALLRGLDRLTFSGPPPAIDVIVVDNDAAASAENAVDDAGWDIALPVRYVVEPRAGIPFARNRVVAEMAPDADMLAFIDDDEVPEEQWLDALMQAMETFDADVVAGPTLRRFDADTPRWVTEGTLFNRKRYATGERRDTADTGNVLTRRRVFERFSVPFDESIGQAGGSDREFYRRVNDADFVIVWADDAIVHERVPPDRATASWVLRRAHHGGNQLAHNALSTSATMAVRGQLLLRAIWSYIKGVLMLPLGLVQGKRGWVRSLWHLYNATGVLVGLRGARLHQYERDQSSE
ncbi:MAG: glycosyltransferase [Planctomycetota bacterium]